MKQLLMKLVVEREMRCNKKQIYTLDMTQTRGIEEASVISCNVVDALPSYSRIP